MRMLTAAACTVISITLAFAAFADVNPMTNDDVIKLVKLTLGDDVVVAKVNQAPHVAFSLETNDLAALKSAGVSGRVIAAMLDRAARDRNVTRPSAPVALSGNGLTPFGSNVPLLRSKDGEKDLAWHTGEGHSAGFYPFVNYFQVLAGVHSSIRTADRKPTLVFQSDVAPQGNVFLVHFESDAKHNERSVKIGSVLKGGNPFSSRNERKPDPDWCIPYDVVEGPVGTWQLTPKAELKPGEYAFYPGFQLWDFGID